MTPCVWRLVVYHRQHYLQARKLRCSTTMLRAILSELEGQGMVLAGKTRQGTRLSASGQRYLDALHAEE